MDWDEQDGIAWEIFEDDESDSQNVASLANLLKIGILISVLEFSS